MAQIIDGLCDFDNVTADMIARHNMSMYGTGDYVLQIDECLEYDLVSNNEIHVKDGMYIMQGRRGCVKKGTTDICIIENGAQAVNRNDIIVIEYVKDEATRLESHTTKVIKGVPAELAVDPELVTGDINAGAVLHQMPLYRVKIEGLNVVAVEQMFEIGSVAAETVNPMEATEPGFAADAYQTKLQFDEQNKNLFKIKTYVGSDGKLHFVDSEGADSVLNFSEKVTLNSVFLVIAATSGYGDQKASFTLKTNGCKTLKISGILEGITGASVAVTSGSSSIGSFTSYSQTTKTFDISKCTVITFTITRSGTLGAGTWSQFTGSVELY